MARGFELDLFLPFRLNRLAVEVSERLAELYAEPFAIDIPQWRVLATLSSGTRTAQEIVASTRTHKSTISRAVQQLEDRALVERAVSHGDKRAMVLRLTGEGRTLFRQLKPVVLAYERKLLAEIGPTAAKALTRGIEELERALGLSEKIDP
jgi:DNA-binding MarR family transcriptional regulator